MFMFARLRFRVFRSLLIIGLLLLIVQLLILDPADRRPFVQNLVLKTLAAVESACTTVKRFLFSDSTTIASPGEREGDPQDSDRGFTPWPTSLAPEPDLPADFLTELELAVARTGGRAERAAWENLCSGPDRGSKLEAAVKLARALPSQWWPVDGELVHELDLPAVLKNRPLK
jgi:hypothetical protein